MVTKQNVKSTEESEHSQMKDLMCGIALTAYASE